jgi:hypothetical protein
MSQSNVQQYVVCTLKLLENNTKQPSEVNSEIYRLYKYIVKCTPIKGNNLFILQLPERIYNKLFGEQIYGTFCNSRFTIRTCPKRTGSEKQVRRNNNERNNESKYSTTGSPLAGRNNRDRRESSSTVVSHHTPVSSKRSRESYKQ